jgi:hypothetical protein
MDGSMMAEHRLLSGDRRSLHPRLALRRLRDLGHGGPSSLV